MTDIGDVLQSRYAIEAIIGEGGMGRVFRARQTLLGRRRVAVKEICLSHIDEADYPDVTLAFLREAETLAHLSHPNLVGVNDCFVEQNQLYLVMEYVDGCTLADVLAENPGGLPIPQVIEWGRQLCTVLAYLHQQSPAIVFRDLKPANIMLDSAKNIRLIDFGIAQRVCEQVGEPSAQGTPGFAPIEQLLPYGVPIHPRSDLYALGATLYHLLTGQYPPDARVRLVDEELVPPEQINPAISPSLSAGLMKLMALLWEDRFDTALHVRDWLDDQRPAPEPSRVALKAWWRRGALRGDVSLYSLFNKTVIFGTSCWGMARPPRELFFRLPNRQLVCVAIDVSRSTPQGQETLYQATLRDPAADVLEALRDALARKPCLQRRTTARTPVDIEVRVHGQGAPGRILDLSPKGARIYTHHSLTPGQTTRLTMLPPAILALTGEVRWCRTRWQGFETGVRWTDLDHGTVQEIRRLLKQNGTGKKVPDPVEPSFSPRRTQGDLAQTR